MIANETPATPALPDLQQAQFDALELQTLLRDIESCAQVMEVIAKFSATTHVADDRPLSIEDGRGLLLSGRARAVQFRYRFEETVWWDTVMALPNNLFRLVRIQHHFDTPAVASA